MSKENCVSNALDIKLNVFSTVSGCSRWL